MNEDSREHRWRRLIAEEREAFERARNAETAGPQRRLVLSREWFAASAKLMKEHHRSYALPMEGGPLEPYPGDAVGRAANLMEHFAAGRLPQPVEDAIGAGGRPEKWPRERRAIAAAIHYLAHVKAGTIKDGAPNVTVLEAFQVDRTTVHSWWRNRKAICEGILDTPAERFPEALRKAGALYHFNRTGERTEGVE